MVKLKNKDKIITYSLAGIIILTVLILFLIQRKSIIDSLDLNFFQSNNYIEILKGLLNTFLITIVAFATGLILGTLVCLIEGYPSQNVLIILLKKLAKIYVSIFRGTPTMVQLLIIYYVIFAFYHGDALVIAMIAFGLNSGAYVSEIIRGGIKAVPIGQMEAGRSLGLSYATVMKKIILPQGFKNAFPSLGNEFITLLKETSIVGFVGAVDLTLAFRKIANATYDYKTVYLVMGATYFLIVLLITWGLRFLERRLIKYAKG